MDKEQRRRFVRRRKRMKKIKVTYTEPKSFNRKKFILTLGIILGTVLAIVFVLSLFFKVGDTSKSVLVAGNKLYTTQEVIEAAGVRQGDSLLSLNRAKIRARILEELPYASSVRVGIKLPGTLKIEITESSVQYSIEANDGNWWLIDSSGKVLAKTNWVDAKDYTQCLGLRILAPKVGQQAAGVDPEPKVDAEGNSVPPLLNGEQSLKTMTQILSLLERLGVLGAATGVNMDDPGNIYITYAERYRIELGNNQNLDKKLSMAVAAMEQLDENRTGVIDVSFTDKPNQVVFTPYAD